MSFCVNLTQNQQSSCKKWNAGLYIRLSREDGDKLESESVTSQRDLLHDFLSRNPDLNLYDLYIDDGYTGTNFDRPNFIRMFEDIKSNKVDCVIVKDLSRFGRNYIDTGNYIEIIFPMLKVRFIAVNDSIDSYLKPESINNVNLALRNLMNDDYCRDTSMKIRSALTVRRENGKYIGSFACYGYLKDPEDHHKLIIDEVASENVKTAFRMFLNGGTLRGIAVYFNDNNILTSSEYKRSIGLNDRHYSTHEKAMWDTIAIRRMLTNEMYIGNMVQKQMEIVSYKVNKCRRIDKDKRIIVKGTHEPIISEEDFYKVQDLLKRDTRISTSVRQLDIFSGFCKCGDCKRGMNKKHIHQPYKEYYYYICSTFKKGGHNACTKHSIQTNVVKDVVFEVLKQYVNVALTMNNIIDFINQSKERNSQTDKFEKQLTAKHKERDKASKMLVDLYPDFKNGLLNQDTYLMFKAKYEQEIVSINEQIAEIENRIEQIKTGLTQENRFISNFVKYQNITELTRDMVVELINNIYIYEGGRIEVEVKFRDEYETALEYIEINRQIYVAEQQFKHAQVAVV